MSSLKPPSSVAMPSLPKNIPIYELLRIKKIDELCDPSKQTWVYETTLAGYSIFSRPAIFGGISLCVGLQAGSASLFEELDEKDAAEFRPYSYQGSFLGPAIAKFAIRITVTTLRSTRSFVTRVITLSQPNPADPSQRRNTLVTICDFARRGREGLLDFSAPALNPVTGQPWERPSELRTLADTVDERRKRAMANKDEDEFKRLDFEHRVASLWAGFIDFKTPKDSLMSQTYWATQTHLPSSQSHVPVTDRVMSDWFRFMPDFSDEGVAKISAERPDCVPFRPSTVHTTLFAFILDQLVPITPVVVTQTPRSAAAPDVSLDFSIRFHREDGLDVNQWTLRHFKALTAAAGRSFSQITLWNEEGQILATMSQQGHLVPRKKPSTAKL
ncbi:hypothetical protein CF319_g8212 [Tilletia indica]|uniref:Thioesterase-like superfamily-domain-containing protein n=1 Tax=Tilletia indica TaxID=43049 RepID=A0A8T8SBU1_9BASI|nr:hypothetical protein CF319_g8212 [Tilletia indica]KAE8236816.1 hypothetical protein A4X13_0g9014 [Tilletia indica]